MSWLITAAADWSPKALHPPQNALNSLSQPAWCFFPHFFLPSGFADSVQCFPHHFSAWPRQPCSLVCAWCASPSTQVAGLCAVRVWSSTWEPAHSFASPAQALHGIAITVRERSLARRDQTGGDCYPLIRNT